MSIIYEFFGMIMEFIYKNLSFNNYGLAIIIFTVFIRLLITPLSIKQIKSTGKTSQMQGELAEVQRLFKGDRERIAEETQKIYQKHNFSPLSGCFPMLIQLPIIFALNAVIREPITYILKKSASVIADAASALGIGAGTYPQLEIMNRLASDPSAISQVSGFAQSEIINFNFLGINLGEIPTINFSVIFENPGYYLPLLLIPILAAVTTYIQSLLMQKMNKSSTSGGGDQPMAAGMMKGMNVLMPIMILVFAFQVPAGLGLYWIVGNIIQILIQYVIRTFVVKKSDDNDIIEVKGKSV